MNSSKADVVRLLMSNLALPSGWAWNIQHKALFLALLASSDTRRAPKRVKRDEFCEYMDV